MIGTNLQARHSFCYYINKQSMMHHQSQPAKVNFGGGDVDDLKEAIKRKLTNLLGTVDAIDITLTDTTRKGLLSQIVWWTEPLVSTAQKPLEVVVA